MKFIALIHDDDANVPITLAGPFPNSGQAQAACEEHLIDNVDRSHPDATEVIDWHDDGSNIISEDVYVLSDGNSVRYCVMPLNSTLS